MLKKPISIAVLILLTIAGCKKDMSSNAISSGSLHSASTIHGRKDTSGRWFGTFHKKNDDPDKLPDTVGENLLIKNGIAGVAYDIDNETTSVGYYLPADRSLAGDSIAFEAAVKDDADVMQMDIMGTQNIASVKYIKGVNNTGMITVEVGSNIQSTQVNAIDFTSFKIMGLVLKGGHAYCYMSNKLMLSLAYPGTSVGTIKMLSTGYNYQQHYWFLPVNGNTACDYIKLYNSYSKKLLMKEEFNLDGSSNTIFY